MTKHFGIRTRTTDPDRWINLPWEKSFTFPRFFYSTKADLGNVAAAKIKALTAELKELDSSNSDAIERIKTGFTQFKTEKYL
jgi:hypothetical protein